MKAFITGASSGIGRDIARVLSEKGWDLIITARSGDRLTALAQEMKTNVKTVTADLSEEAEVLGLYEKIKDEDIDLFVNNAGFGAVGKFTDIPLKDETEMIKTNITAAHILLKLIFRDMIKKNRGTVLNTASSAAFLPAGPYFATYYASKCYLYSLSRALSEEAKGTNVKVCVLCPGPVNTDFGKRARVTESLPGLDSRYVAMYAVNKALKGKEVIIPGFDIKLLKFATRIVPDRLLIKTTARQQKKKM